MAYRVDQMGFAETDTAVDKEWIVMLTRLVRDGHTSRMGKLVASAYNEVFEGILWNQAVKISFW